MYENNLNRFFNDYPDGRLISTIRDPKSWYVSAKKNSTRRKYQNIKDSIEMWKCSANAMLNNRKKYGDKVYLMSFEKLINEPKYCMQKLS